MPTPRSLALAASAFALSFPLPGFAPASALADKGIAADANPGATPIDPTTLHLRAGEIRVPELRGGLQNFVSPANDPAPIHYVIQLDGPMTPRWRQSLTDAGVRLLDYLPANAFIARLDGADAGRVAALDFIRWHGPYQDAWKVDPEVAKRPFTTPERGALAAAGKSQLIVTLFDGQNPAQIAQVLNTFQDAQLHSTDFIDANPVLSVTLATADIPRLAQLAAVQFVEEAPELTLRSNSNNRWVVQTNMPNVTPFYTAGIRGEGQIVGVIDSRIEASHCSFNDTVPIGPDHRKIVAFNATSGTAASHGTHVAGTVVGDSGTDDNLRGVAYMGRLVHNVIPSFTEAAIRTMLTTHHNQGARVHTNSWGDDGTTAYNALCRGFDDFQWLNEDSMVTLAVTNSSSLKNPENAKNLLACGATDPVPGQNTHCFGGTGPTSDQRRKPEIYAPGCSTISAANGTACGTRTSSGTSMATPAIAGAAMLARQYYTEGFYPSGFPNPADAFVPSGTLVKATLLNSTVDLTGPAGFPSNQEGWGRVLLDNAVYFPGDTRRTLVHDVRNADGLSTGQFAEVGINVLSSTEGLNLTLVWTEPAAAAGAAVATINNLDLVVTGPDGAVYRGNVFAGGQSAPGGDADVRNNVEQVRISVPTPGFWTARIDATAVNQSTQGYALVASGDVLGGPAGVRIILETAVPGLIAPGAEQVYDVTIDPGDDTLIADSALLAYRFDNGPFSTTPLIFVEDFLYRAVVPAASCGQVPQFYFTASGVDSGVVTHPFNAPASFLATSVGVDTLPFADSFDTDLGWTVVNVPVTGAFTGAWERGVPNPATGTPLADAEATGAGFCFVTDNRIGNFDIDAGITTLTSPRMDASGGEATISYHRWFYNGNSAHDTLRVEISGDDGATWELLENYGPVALGGWNFATFPIPTALATEEFRIRFTASDLEAQAIVEAAVDGVRVDVRACEDGTDCPADWNGDTVVNSGDISAFLTAWLDSVNNMNLIADFNNDTVVNSGDISSFLTAWLAAVGGDC